MYPIISINSAVFVRLLFRRTIILVSIHLSLLQYETNRLIICLKTIRHHQYTKASKALKILKKLSSNRHVCFLVDRSLAVEQFRIGRKRSSLQSVGTLFFLSSMVVNRLGMGYFSIRHFGGQIRFNVLISDSPCQSGLRN